MNDDEKQKNDELAARLIWEQNFAAALIVGAAASILAAAAFGMTVATWPFAYGFAAAGIGIFVGLSMRFLGRGITTKFAVAAALFTTAGCMLGYLFRVIVDLAVAGASSPVDVLRQHSLSSIAGRAAANFSLIDLVYWFVAVFCAVYLAKRPLSRSERLAIGMSGMGNRP